MLITCVFGWYGLCAAFGGDRQASNFSCTHLPGSVLCRKELSLTNVRVSSSLTIGLPHLDDAFDSSDRHILIERIADKVCVHTHTRTPWHVQCAHLVPPRLYRLLQCLLDGGPVWWLVWMRGHP